MRIAAGAVELGRMVEPLQTAVSLIQGMQLHRHRIDAPGQLCEISSIHRSVMKPVGWEQHAHVYRKISSVRRIQRHLENIHTIIFQPGDFAGIPGCALGDGIGDDNVVHLDRFEVCEKRCPS
jgi:hypothetical protein